MTRRAAWTGVAVAALVALGGCSSGSPSGAPAGSTSAVSSARPSASVDPAACHRVATRLLASVQRYVDAYGAPLGSSSSGGGQASSPSNPDLRAALQRAQLSLQNLGCDLNGFRQDFRAGLEGVRARGPLARAVLLRLEASLTGGLGVAPKTRTVGPRADLARVLASLAPGSTVRLRPGGYRLDESLVLLQGVTLRGAGRDRTRLTSTAAGSAVLVLTDGRVELADLTVRHAGRTAASVLLGGPTSSVVLQGARVSGGRSRNGQGGNGVTMTARSGEEANRGTTLEVTDTELAGNDAAGILLTGGHRASVRASRFVRNGQCGICFAGASGGAVRGSRFEDNGTGAAVLGTAQAALTGDTFVGGQVGVQVSGRGAPVVRGVSVRGAVRAAMIFSERSFGRVDRSTCAAVPYGIVVGPKALPYLGDNDCTLARTR